MAFLSGFLATALGVGLTFAIDGRISAAKRAKTARLLATQIVEKMERTHKDMSSYMDYYNIIDSTSAELYYAIDADTLDRVSDTTKMTFISYELNANVQVDADNGLDAFRADILSTLGDVELIGHIDEYYSTAHQFAKISAQVFEQKVIVTDLFYTHFYGNDKATWDDYILYFYKLPEFKTFYTRMENVLFILRVVHEAMNTELEACKARLQ